MADGYFMSFLACFVVLCTLGLPMASAQGRDDRADEPFQAHCSENPGAWIQKTECPEGGFYYFSFEADPGSGASQTLDTATTNVLMELRSPMNCRGSKSGCTHWDNDLTKEGANDTESGYDVYVSSGCVPTKDNYNSYLDTGIFQSKQVHVPILTKGTYVVAVRYRGGDAPCNFTMSTGALYAAQGADATCTAVVEADKSVLAVCKEDLPEFFKARSELITNTQGVSPAAYVVPIVLIFVVAGVVFGVLYAKKRKKDARMGKFAALSRGAGGQGSSAGGGGAMADA